MLRIIDETDVNIIAMAKGEERYVIAFSEANRAEALKTLGRWASDPELNFDWYSAAVLSQRIRTLETCEGK